MNKMSIVFVISAAVLVAGCGNEKANFASTLVNNVSNTSAIETQRREVTFSVPDMTCPMCPITVRKALVGVDGVAEAEASLDDKQARVVFDPAKTSIDALIAAVAETGFTATPNEQTDGNSR